MPAPNLFLIYVEDTAAATAFYRDLLEIEPDFVSPRYVAFEVAPGVLFALWAGHRAQPTRADGAAHLRPDSRRTSEVGLMVPGPDSAIDDLYLKWVEKGVHVVAEPHTAVFGRTFMVTDPDGNLIRVSPMD